MKGFSFKGLVDLAQEAWNLATASVKKSGDTMTGDLILKPGTATPLTLGRGSQVSLRYEYAADAYKYLGVSTDGTIRYSNTPDLALDGQKIYHQGFKPTAADVGAVAKTGDTMTGELNMNGNKIFMDNANIDGLNCLTFSDAATNQSEGIRWPTTDGSTTYDGIHAAGGSLYFNGTKKVYHQGFKPTASEVGAVAKTGDTMSGSLTVRTKVVLEDADGTDKAMFGIGNGDIVIHNTTANKYLQLKDDGTLQYSNNMIYHQGFKPNSTDVGAVPNRGTSSGTEDIFTRDIGSYDISSPSTTPNWPLPSEGGSLFVQHHGAYRTRLATGAGSGDMYLSVGTEADPKPWSRVYTSAFPPTAADVGAVSKSGDTMTGFLTVDSSGTQVVHTHNGIHYKDNNILNWNAYYDTTDGSYNVIQYSGDTGTYMGPRFKIAPDGAAQLANPKSMSAQGTTNEALTRKDYVDAGLLTKVGVDRVDNLEVSLLDKIALLEARIAQLEGGV